ncbi:MAG: UDP-N-acetylmuramate dehydrogenase [Bacteroidales bacterium]|jgi:UDP-N-acetylmuramate dehydrogenase|nr:UDP-N-acetylmuramate dehydrogenase [Bacteroidales bacterium]
MSIRVQKDFNLKTTNTFNIEAKCSYYVEYFSNEEIINFFKENPEILKSEYLILGNGSNILFTKDFCGTIIRPRTSKINIKKEDKNNIYITTEAGLDFDNFVEWTIKHEAFGLENLSAIPGTVGASAIQNIGAYGAEIGNFIHEVKFLNLTNLKIKKLKNSELQYGYRDSIFKKELKNKILILSVTYKLTKKFSPNLSYIDLAKLHKETRAENQESKSKNQEASKIRQEVIEIRNQKLPDYRILGNAGSFFKNPIISKEKFLNLKEKFPDIKYFDYDKENIKIAAGWLIDKCGFKGYSYNNAAVHQTQALIIINKGNCTANDILKLSEIIQKKIRETFDIQLEPEVIFV